MWKFNGLDKYSEARSPVSIRPDGPVQARTVGVRVGSSGEGVGGTGEAVMVGVKAGVGVGEDVRVVEVVEAFGRSVVMAVNVTAMGDTTASWLDEQAVSPIPSHRLDANSTTTLMILPISRECTRKLAIAGKYQ